MRSPRSRYFSTTPAVKGEGDPPIGLNGSIGFIGLGMMGAKMVQNLARSLPSQKLLVHDSNPVAVQSVINNSYDVDHVSTSSSAAVRSSSLSEIASTCAVVFTMLPNDKIVEEVSLRLLDAAAASSNSDGTSPRFIHLSCSTVSPLTARRLSSQHAVVGQQYVSCPVFARPDGIARRQATWLVSGVEGGGEGSRSVAVRLLQLLGAVEDLGDDPGAANVVKLCGNFMIAASIEAIGESMVLAEKSGVDREAVMRILSSSIFDCLIYKGYGQRVSQRDHRPGGFSLELGLKDVSLVSQAARDADAPMPFVSVLLDRYVASKAKGRGSFDWSAIGLHIAEDAGIDVSVDIDRTNKEIKDGRKY